jgi:hypothetical protein
MISDPDSSRRLKAADMILDRGIGKPAQAVEHSVTSDMIGIKLVDAPAQETYEQWIERKDRERKDNV